MQRHTIYKIRQEISRITVWEKMQSERYEQDTM